MRAWLLLASAFVLTLPSLVHATQFAGAQEPVAEDLNALVKKMKARKLSWDEKAEAMDELLAMGEAGQAELCEYMAKVLRQMDKEWAKSTPKFEKAFAKEASQIATKRLTKKTLKQVESLRKELLKVSRDANLTKDTVKKVADVKLAGLQEIYVVGVSQVWDASTKLEAEWRELLQLLDDRLWLHGYWEDARKELLYASDAWSKKSYVSAELADPENWEVELLARLETACRFATAMPERDRSTLEWNREPLQQLTDEEAIGVRRLNDIRIWAGLSALRLDLKLCEAGRGHSEDMVTHSFFAHESPVPGKKSPSDRAAAAGTSGGAENIAAGQRSGWDAISAWWYSPGHHRNMMGGHSTVGLGRFQNHWTQMFG